MADDIAMCRLPLGASAFAAEAWMMMKPLELWVGRMEDRSRRHLSVQE